MRGRALSAVVMACVALGLGPLAVADAVAPARVHATQARGAHGARGGGAGEPVPRQSLTCVANGTGGQRVEVLYLHGPSAPAAASARRADIQRWAEQVEWTVAASARRPGGDRRVRWRTDSCDLRISSVRLSSGALDDFRDMVEDLRDRGLGRRDRTYRLFVDSGAHCGIATAPRDDDAPDNRADDDTPGAGDANDRLLDCRGDGGSSGAPSPTKDPVGCALWVIRG